MKFDLWLWVTFRSQQTIFLDAFSECWNQLNQITKLFISFFARAWKLVYIGLPPRKTYKSYFHKETLLRTEARCVELSSCYFIVLSSLSLCHRFPWNVLRLNTMRNSWTWQDMGIGTVLWSLDLCRFRRHPTKVSFIKLLIKTHSYDSKLFQFSFEDCLSLSRIADLSHLPMTNANWTPMLPTKQLRSHTAVRPSSARLEPS